MAEPIDSLNVAEPFNIDTAAVDGAVTIAVDRYGVARVLLYENRLEADGSMTPTLSARLVMRHEVLVELGHAMVMSFNGMDPAVRVDTRRRLKMI